MSLDPQAERRKAGGIRWGKDLYGVQRKCECKKKNINCR